MRDRVMVVTNNETVELLANDVFVPGSLLAVLMEVRDLVHRGHRLITHPLVGSVKPNETPFKSVVLTKNKKVTVDFTSLSLIESSLQMAEKMLLERPLPVYPDRVIEDFLFIDYDLLQTALNSLPVNL